MTQFRACDFLPEACADGHCVAAPACDRAIRAEDRANAEASDASAARRRVRELTEERDRAVAEVARLRDVLEGLELQSRNPNSAFMRVVNSRCLSALSQQVIP